MSNESKKYSLDEKTKIALEASSGSVEETAGKYGLKVSEVEEFMRETGVESVKTEVEESDDVTLEVTDDFANSYEFGVTPDKLNYGRLTFWSVFGTAVILLMIISIMYVYDYSFQSIDQQRSAESVYYDITEQKERDRVRLDSFGVVDLEEGVYHIPIDSAIARIATDRD